MAQVSDFVLDNQGFSSFRTELNNILAAQNSNNSGTSRPSSATTGTLWLDTTNAGSNTLTLKFFDGSDDITLADIDTSANTVNFIDSSVTAATEVLNDTSPQLGGNLDTNSHNIDIDDAHGIRDENGNEQIIFQTTTSAVNQIDVTNSATGNAPEISATGDDTNIDLKLTPKGSGKLNLDGIKFPNADGTANQILTTDGSGNLSFSDASSGGTEWQSSVKTADFTAVANQGFWVNTASGDVVVTLPSSPSVGDIVELADFNRSWGTHSVTLDDNGSNFQGTGSSVPVYNENGQHVILIYSGSTNGWIPKLDSVVADKTQTIIRFLNLAGGGAGGANQGGGGGAGGIKLGTAVVTAGDVYQIGIGGGGSGSPANNRGGSGSASTIRASSGGKIISLTTGGGGGGGRDSGATDGGCGGGNSTPSSTTANGKGTVGEGFDGGGGSKACGGGGTGEAGHKDGSPASAPGVTKKGGDGIVSGITGTSTNFGGGGGGATPSTGAANGGAGGGTRGELPSSSSSAAAANSGSGSGGTDGSGTSGAGGSGVVILRVRTAAYPGTTTGSPTVTTDGEDTIIKFTGSGTYTA